MSNILRVVSIRVDIQLLPAGPTNSEIFYWLNKSKKLQGLYQSGAVLVSVQGVIIFLMANRKIKTNRIIIFFNSV